MQKEVRLRTVTVADRSLFLCLFTCPKTRQYLGGPLNAQDAEAKLTSLFEETTETRWIVEFENSSVGVVSVGTHIEFGVDELSYQLLPEFCGRGIAYTACRQVMEFYSFLVAEAQAENHASLQLLERLGFQEIKRLHRYSEQQVYCEWAAGELLR